MATSSVDMSVNGALETSVIPQQLQPANDEDDDDFNDIIAEDAPGDHGDKVNCVAINYKVSFDQYQKVDVFQSTTSITEKPLGTITNAPQLQTTERQENDEVAVPPLANESSVSNTSVNSESTLTPDNAAPPSNGSTTLMQTPDHQQSDETGGAKSEVPPPSDLTLELAGGPGDTDNILKAEVSRAADPSPSEQLLRAQAEWAAVETIQPGTASPGKHSVVRTAPLASFNEALGFFQTRNMDQYLRKIKPCIQRSGFAALRHMVLGPPKMNRNLLDERNLVFAIAQYSFDDNEEIHKRVLQTIYRQLTGSAIDCPRFGSHWEQIGFQGTDPATDLRACGFLGLLTLLDFVMDSQKLPLAKDIYRLSLHETQNFPFCVMSINMTRIALQTLREELLSRECNRRKQVFGVINDFYASLFLQLYQTWKQQRKTIHDSGFVLKDLEANCKKNPRTFMRDLDLHLAERSTRGNDLSPRSGGGASPRKEKYDMEFAGVHELTDKKG